MVVSFNLCALPREQKYQIQLDYEASFWAYQIKRNKKTREQVYNTIHSRPVAEQTFLKQQFEQYLALMLSYYMYTVQKLDTLKIPLVNKFYTLYSVRGRANKQDQVWVVYSEMQIVAACRIQNKHDFLFLSTVFVAPQHRAKGLAKQLVCAAIKQQSMPLYTFAYKNITALYTSLGFNQVLTYTPGLKALFDIYTHRNIVALEYL